MLLCRACLGEVQVIEDADPQAHTRTGPGEAYDTTLGDRESAAGTYREFVVSSKHLIYPEYAIIYERVYADHRVRGLRLAPRREKAGARPLREPPGGDTDSEEEASDSEYEAPAPAGNGYALLGGYAPGRPAATPRQVRLPHHLV